jgi:UDP-2,3-diacylglucosamine pyrophosphatase LpxH
MNTNTLPTDELKKHGIINEDNSFSKKLNAEDIQKFLQGYTIVADHDKHRATFQLTDNNTKLKVIFLERDKSISDILENSKNTIQYTDVKNVSKYANELSFEKKAFIFDKETEKVVEFDFIKNARELTAIIADIKSTEELNRYIAELLKLKSFLQDKIDQFPEMAKEITNDLNIVSKEFNAVAGISEKHNHSQKQEKSDIQLNVNDPDFYQDANRLREEESQEQNEEIQKSRGFRR